jgi:hypothetical protein
MIHDLIDRILFWFLGLTYVTSGRSRQTLKQTRRITSVPTSVYIRRVNLRSVNALFADCCGTNHSGQAPGDLTCENFDFQRPARFRMSISQRYLDSPV